MDLPLSLIKLIPMRSRHNRFSVILSHRRYLPPIGFLFVPSQITYLRAPASDIHWDFPYNPVYSCSTTPLSLIFHRISNLSRKNQDFSNFILKVFQPQCLCKPSQRTCIACYFCPMKVQLQFLVKIDSQSILASFTNWVLQIRTVKTGLNGIHKFYTIKSVSNVLLNMGNPG